MSIIRAELLADEITNQLQHTADGHCARVDFLERIEAMLLCQCLEEKCAGENIAFRLLTTRDASDQMDSIFISADEAIEMRNRKSGRLCLFVPSDLVDAASSSLSNSFALIDGRK